MATGEGKTLVATLPLYLNALSGRNAQLVTANDYLARRDAEWMGYIYSFLGVSVGCIQQLMAQRPPARDVQPRHHLRHRLASSASTTCATTAWPRARRTRSSATICTASWTRSTRSSSTRPGRRSSSPVRRRSSASSPSPASSPSVEQLVNDADPPLQQAHHRGAGDSWKSPTLTTDDRDRALRKMLQVKMGHPKNKQLMRLMETPEWRKLLDKVETEMNSDLNKDELYRLKEELFYVIDERQHQADLTEIGRTKLHPDNPGRVHAARPGHRVQRPREEPRPHAGGEGEAPDRGPAALRGRQRGHPRDQPAPARLFALRARRRVRGPGRQGDDRRREHRPRHARPALVRRPAPGGRGQGERGRSSARRAPTPRSRSRTTSACTRSWRA